MSGNNYGDRNVSGKEGRSRVAVHRRKVSAQGGRRVEVAVPGEDAPLVRGIAAVLRSGGAAADELRRRVRPIVAPVGTRTGADLIAFFQSSPLAGIELEIERDRSPGRVVELE